MICTDPTCSIRPAHDHDDDLAWFNAWAADPQRVSATAAKVRVKEPSDAEKYRLKQAEDLILEAGFEPSPEPN